MGWYVHVERSGKACLPTLLCARTSWSAPHEWEGGTLLLIYKEVSRGLGRSFSDRFSCGRTARPWFSGKGKQSVKLVPPQELGAKARCRLVKGHIHGSRSPFLGRSGSRRSYGNLQLAARSHTDPCIGENASSRFLLQTEYVDSPRI